jgi:hypothetical protein
LKPLTTTIVLGIVLVIIFVIALAFLALVGRDN